MSIGSNLLRFSDQPLLLLDGECQRVNTMAANLPFEWAYVEATMRGNTVRPHSYYLKWPNYRMSEDAARITRFNRAWVDNGHDPEFVLDAWESHALRDDVLLIGHNILSFDLPLWCLWRRTLGRGHLKNEPSKPYLRVVDTHLLARAYKEGFRPPVRNADPYAFWAWQYKVSEAHRKGVKTNLTQMCKDLSIPVDETKTHGATYDLSINLEVYRKLVNLVEI